MIRSAACGVRVRLLDPIPAAVVMAIAEGLGARGHAVEIQGEGADAAATAVPTLGLVERLAHADGRATDVFLTCRPLASEGGRPVLGLASRERDAALVCVPRGPDETRFDAGIAARVLKLVLHELGELEGRAVCEDPRCFMSHAEVPADLDACEARLCARCADATP